MMKIKDFREMILSNYRQAGRKFPWRGADPWGVMVSEFMLQQTRTDRVIQYWENWMQKWPNPQALAKTPMEEVMRHWLGLGYYLRCYYLKNSAVMITEENNGIVPNNPAALRFLPGIGSYMAGAIACFAYNYPCVFIDTNIRATMIHCFFPGKDNVKDQEIFPILESALYKKDPRTWYYALMDYGVSLKKTTENPGRRSAHYSTQGRYPGSFRQARGKVMRALATIGSSNAKEIETVCGLGEENLYRVLERLEKESLVAEEKGIYRIKDWSITNSG